MSPIVHLRKCLTDPPAVYAITGVIVRNLRVPDDVDTWLQLRERAIAGLIPRPRSWHHGDFVTEIFEKPWFDANVNWIAALNDSPAEAIGAVTLALREGAAKTVPVVHWLLVEPAHRRRGIARLLMAHLERGAWNAGHREVQLETHAAWRDAAAFYQSIGYKRSD